MREQDFLGLIEKTVGNEFIGDDCAYLKDLGIVVTQDSLVEGIHFQREWCTPEQLGYKSVAVNISDILASGAKPMYITIALSLPNDINEDFVKCFYEGAAKALNGAKIVGGDITGSKNGVMISITAIGSDKERRISSRKNAKEGYVVVVKGMHGTSASGLKELINGGNNQELIKAHLEPELEVNFSEFIAKNSTSDYAMMDTSDGLADALFKIAESSGVTIKIDYDKIPRLKNTNKNNVLFGGEDYGLVAAIPRELAVKAGAAIVGEVLSFNGIRLDISGETFLKYDDLTAFNHFKP